MTCTLGGRVSGSGGGAGERGARILLRAGYFQVSFTSFKRYPQPHPTLRVWAWLSEGVWEQATGGSFLAVLDTTPQGLGAAGISDGNSK